MKRSRKIAAIVPFAVFLVGLASAAHAASAATEDGPLAEQTVLRLNDLPGGYVVGPAASCGPLEVHSYTHKVGLEAWAKAHSPFACQLLYRRLYRPRGAAASPPFVATASVTTESVAAAQAAGPVGAELVENLTDARAVSAAPASGAIGEETRVFRSAEFDGEYRPEPLPGVAVLWRAGTALEVVYAGGWDYAKDERAAYALAAIQADHVAAPSPYLASEGDDVPTYFENPALKLPTYWLGSTFSPGGGLERSYFSSVRTRTELGQVTPGLGQVVEYAPSLFLDSWAPRAWARFLKTPAGYQQSRWHCTRTREISIPHGRATIYAAYKKDYATCPHSSPHHLSAQVQLPGVVITIGVPICPRCESGTLSYESIRGLTAVIRGLHRWRPGDES
jgi:hypothetical protein